MTDDPSRRETAIIIGAGPAGLTAAYELLQRTRIRPVVIEQSDSVGGIARTVRYKGNRMDIGGHRFFSKSDRVMDWWFNILPLARTDNEVETISYRSQHRDVLAEHERPDPDEVDHVFLVRNRKTRILFDRKLFGYPLRLDRETLANLGMGRVAKIALSYGRSLIFPIRNEQTLRDFLMNRFGAELYRTFFEAYTEKVWGVPGDRISAEWGRQRIKGLSIGKSLGHFLSGLFARNADIAQKRTETSLIERFLYPKLGAGQMWEQVAEALTSRDVPLMMGCQVRRLHVDGDRVTGVSVFESSSGRTVKLDADLVFSTMPVRDLVRAIDADVPDNVREVSEGLVYRHFIIVGLLVRRVKFRGPDSAVLSDNWIYVQEPDVRLGRIDVFNNWSPYLVKDPASVWLGLEYFCDENDELWNATDAEVLRFAQNELEQIGFIDHDDTLDGVVVRMPKAYPGYFGTYGRFEEIRRFVDGYDNLYLIGRNGMHKYNNQDHSMLTAMHAVDNIVAGIASKDNIWAVNTEAEYHEERS